MRSIKRYYKILWLLVVVFSVTACHTVKGTRIDYADAQSGRKLNLPKDFLHLSDANDIPEINTSHNIVISDPLPPDYDKP